MTKRFLSAISPNFIGENRLAGSLIAAILFVVEAVETCGA
jgi:hypothetical protein